jgi:enamidase
VSSIILRNIGALVSGILSDPILEADCVVIKDRRIEKIGYWEKIEKEGVAETVIDVNGMTVCPGLIDAHVHPVLVDFVPSLKAVDWFDSCLHGGVTSMVSLGEIYQPGRPRDSIGAKALAVTARKVYENYHPGGVKVDGGAVMLENGLTEHDFLELAQAGCKRIGEVGMGGVKDPGTVKQMVSWAREAGLKITVHAGGASVPGSGSYGAGEILSINPDIIAHLNGAPTPPPTDHLFEIIRQSGCYIDLIDGGSPKAALEVMNEILRAGTLERIMLGTNAPSMAGFAPTGLWMLMGMLCAFTDLKPEQALAMATGNTRDCYELDPGVIREGCPADLLVADAAVGSVGEDMLAAIKAGDLIGLAMVIIDGKICAWQSRNTTPPKRNYHVQTYD